jgi:hypothetical protein
MKKQLVLAGLLLCAFPLAASPEALDPKEPVTLELHDADLTKVITTLGAMANLPVVIEAGIEGKVTIRMESVPFEKILAALSRDNGISLRIEDGKLVASRVKEVPASAPALPERFRAAPRILLADYASAAANPPPLLISTTWNGEEMCSIARIGIGGGGLLEVPLSKGGSPAALVVADLGYDPVLKIRAIALEALDGTFKQAFSLGPDQFPAVVYKAKDGKAVRLLVSQAARLVARFTEKGNCANLVFQPSSGGTPVTVTMQAAALSEEGASSPLFSPRIQTTAGTVFKALGSEAESGAGQLRGYAVTGYVSRDGTRAALAFKARAVWTDPEDGRQYCFTQAGSQVGFFPLTKWAAGGFPASAVAPGVATPRALELRVLGEE